MRTVFWEKLSTDQRNFKWFFDNYIKDKYNIDLTYNTLYKQAQGVFLRHMCPELKMAIKDYLKEK